MTLGLVGRKVGMTRVFTDDGDSLPVTVLDVSDNRVTQIKSAATDGYSAVQVTFGKRRASRVNKAATGHLAKAAVEAGHLLREFRVPESELGNFKLGGKVGVDIFKVGQKVDVSGMSQGKGFAGVIKRHHFSSNRASHGNSLSTNKPGSTGMAQDPGRVFPGKRMAGHLGAVQRTVQGLEVVRVDAERQLLLIKGSVPGGRSRARGQDCTCARGQGGLMELKLINEQGKSAASVAASDALFGREFNESLVHQIVIAYQANARRGTRAQKGRSDVRHSHKKPWRQKGTGRARSGDVASPLWRGGGKIFPNLPDENFSHKVNRKMYRAGMCSILSQLAREERLRVVESFSVAAPKTKLLAQKLKQMGLGSALVITDEADQNLLLSSRNLVNVRVLDVNHADPVSLIQFEHVILTKKAIARFEEILK